MQLKPLKNIKNFLKSTTQQQVNDGTKIGSKIPKKPQNVSQTNPKPV